MRVFRSGLVVVASLGAAFAVVPQGGWRLVVAVVCFQLLAYATLLFPDPRGGK